MDLLFSQLAIVLGLSSALGFIVYKLKLPLLIAYLLVGVIIAAQSVFNFQNSPVAVLPELGTAFALFLIGMELDLREITSLGKPIIVTSLIQIVISAIAGVTLATFFGFKGLEAQYLGIGLSFSSTIVVVKLLLERKDLKSLYGKLAIGITLLEDLVAIIILMVLSGNNLGLSISDPMPLLVLAVKGLLLLLSAFVLSKFVLTQIFKAMSQTPELLFLVSLTWCFIFVSVSTLLGFSVVIGAFVSGVALASSPFHYHISGRVKPLRDFFVVLFFVYLGSQAGISTALNNVGLIVIFALYALLIKPLIFLLSLGTLGFRKHTIFQTAMSLGQISEFSLIILLVGEKAGLVSQTAISVMAFSVTLSILLSSILISKSKLIYSNIKWVLGFFERKDAFTNIEEREVGEIENHVVLIGANRLGGPIASFLQKHKIPLRVLDFNPDVISDLKKKGIDAIYGDASDTEVLEHLSIGTAALVISTATDINDNKSLLSEIKRMKSPAKVAVRATEEDEVGELKKRGADYVILPEITTADYLVSELKKTWPKVYFSTPE